MKVKINKDIWTKAYRAIEDDHEMTRYISTCKAAHICPNCGEELKIYTPFTGGVYLKCTKCDWKDV